MGFLSALAVADSSIRFFHLVGVIVTVGCVATTDVLLLSLHARPKMAPILAKLSPILSLLVWLGLILLSLTGMMLFIARLWLGGAPLFQFKMALVMIVFLNGAFLTLWVTPRFQKLASNYSERTLPVIRFERVAALASGISMLGWWTIIAISYIVARIWVG
jgi:hypothetical protein